MDHFKRLRSQLRLYLAVTIILASTLLVGSWWWLTSLLSDQPVLKLAVVGLEAVLIAVGVAIIISDYVLEPLKFIWQAILHVSPGNSSISAPNIESARVGRELVTSLCLQVYQLAGSAAKTNSQTKDGDVQANAIISNLPLPLIVMDKDQTVIFANEAAYKYLSKTEGSLEGNNFYSLLNLSFPTTDTFDKWLNESKAQSVVSSHSWERVRLQLPEKTTPLQFDMVAYYNKQNPTKVETIVALFDHTERYSQDDDGISFIALAVHELRTPLTLLRGYIEVFEDELSGKLDPELTGYMRKMNASAQQLSAFVNNILNVARIEGDQLTLQLREENWNDIVESVVRDLGLRLEVVGKSVELQLAEDLPSSKPC